MKVTAIRKRYSTDNKGICGWREGDISEVKLEHFDKCCDASQEAFDGRFIGFGEFDSVLNKMEAVCIYSCSPYQEGAVWDAMPINHCPFCGAEIELLISG